MITNRYKYFRWTRRTAGITVMYVFVVPSIIGYLGYKTDVSLAITPSGVAWCGWRTRLADLGRLALRVSGTCGRSGEAILFLSVEGKTGKGSIPFVG
jgi:hypothetical protein